MNLLRRLLTVPTSNATTQIEVAQTWEVRWWSLEVSSCHRDDQRYADPKERVEVFFTLEEAERFAASLENAKALLRDGGRLKATIVKTKSP